MKDNTRQVINSLPVEDIVNGTMSELVSHNGIPVKPGKIVIKDSFRYRGTLEENVSPVAPPFIWFDENDEVQETTRIRELTPG